MRYLLCLPLIWALAHARDFDSDTIRVAVSDWLDDPEAATTKYGAPIEDWKTWRVTDMSRLFQGAENFTANLNGWDTASVTDFNHMFAGCPSFDSPLDGWDVSHVTDFSLMFYGASKFTGETLGAWDTSSAESMEQMFLRATNFVGPENIEDWNVSSVTSMYAMFFEASSFNRPVNNWDMTNVRYTNSIFEDAKSFTQQVCWSTTNPRARFFQGFCGTKGAAFESDSSCSNQIHPSMRAYSQACDPDDLLEEIVATQTFDRPADIENLGLDASGGFIDAIAGLPSLGSLADPEEAGTLDGNGTADGDVSGRGVGDFVVIAAAQREISAADSWSSARPWVSLLSTLALMTVWS